MTTETNHARQPRGQVRRITVEISPGELIDKITILEIKNEQIADVVKLRNVRVELDALRAVRDAAVQPSQALAALTDELKGINEALWQIEDQIRVCEQQRVFGARFIELARSVYRQNDRRSLAKRRINELLGSRLVEEKSYTSYE